MSLRPRSRITIVTPAPRGSRQGNRVTAERWAGMLRALGHVVTVRQDWRGEPCDVLVALHARKSAPAALRFARRHPERPLIVGLAGTDVYSGSGPTPRALTAIMAATRLVVLQPLAVGVLPPEHRAKARVILQSAEPRARPSAARRGSCDIAVVGHLRAVKDPFRAALAARLLPAASRVRILHAGGALQPGMAARARREQLRNARYRWLGELSHRRTRELAARCEALVVSSWSEGGANVVSEAVTSGTPVLASRVPGNVALLGADHAAYFDAGSAAQLAELMLRLETDTAFRRALRTRTRELAARFRPSVELAAWRRLLLELSGT